MIPIATCANIQAQLHAARPRLGRLLGDVKRCRHPPAIEMSALLDEYGSRCSLLQIAHHPVLVAQLSTALQSGNSIAFINAAGGGLTHRDLDALLFSLQQFERAGKQALFHLDLSDAWGEASHPACVITLVSYLRQLRGVSHLVMRGCRLSDADGEAIVCEWRARMHPDERRSE